jgi:hypothetical protein
MRDLHDWDLSYGEARRVQVELAGRVEFVPLKEEPKLIGGFDWAFSGDGKKSFAAAVVLRFKPVFVVVGHKCRLEDAIRITPAYAARCRIPEPTRLTHQAGSKLRSSLAGRASASRSTGILPVILKHGRDAHATESCGDARPTKTRTCRRRIFRVDQEQFEAL